MTDLDVVRLHSIALTVSDLDASVEWYSEVFGVQHVMDAPHPGGWAGSWPTTPSRW